MADKPSDDQKFTATVKNLLKTPPKPHAKATTPLNDGDSFVVIEGRMLIAASQIHNDDGSITADLFRNLDDYVAGLVMEPSVTFWR